MKQAQADEIKAQATRMLLTCVCGHPIGEHRKVEFFPDSTGLEYGVPRYFCPYKGCGCTERKSLISGVDKLKIDEAIDAQLRRQSMALIMQNQQPRSPNGFGTTGAHAPERGSRVRDGRAALSTADNYKANYLRRGSREGYRDQFSAAEKEFGTAGGRKL